MNDADKDFNLDSPESYYCCDAWPNRHLPGGYGPVLSETELERFATAEAD